MSGDSKKFAIGNRLAAHGSDPRSTARRPERPSDLLGQVFTPEPISRRMARELLRGRQPSGVRILDPCCGPGTFTSALWAEQVLGPEDEIIGFDLDPEMVRSATMESAGIPIADISYQVADFLTCAVNPIDFVIMNPPYVRQEWIDLKKQYREIVGGLYGSTPPGTSNLYVYFVAKALADLKTGGRFAFILYDSWQYTTFGTWLRNLLLNTCTDVEVLSAGKQPFGERLIDATIIYGTKAPRESKHHRECGRSRKPAVSGISIADAFQTNRGLRLKQSSFFLCRLDECDALGATPFLKKVGSIPGYRVPDEHPEAAILVYGPESNQKAEAELERRLSNALLKPDANKTVLNWYEQRPRNWQYHRRPPSAPIVFNYYLRNRPRHIHNPTRPYSDNFYGLIPRGAVSEFAWLALLNSTAVASAICHAGRNQGNGLLKIQLFEYRNVVIPNLDTASAEVVQLLTDLGARLAAGTEPAKSTIDSIDGVVDSYFGDYVAASERQQPIAPTVK